MRHSFAFLLAIHAIVLATVALSDDAVPELPNLEKELLKEDAAALAKAAREQGDPTRGAIVFYQQHLTCTKCHTFGEENSPLGPDLTKPTNKDEVTDVLLVESVLQPSKQILKGYETVVVINEDGLTITGLLAEDRPDELVIRDPAKDGKLVTVPKNEIEEQGDSKDSVMPKGLVNQLANRQQFLDLMRYVMEITEKGPQRAKELEPEPSLYALVLPEYEDHVDHAGMIADMNKECFKRGEAIYNRLCINCHGTKDQPGSLPTSLRFASDKFRNGSDPHSMYNTLTRGFGMMAPQTWMVPQQKYDVIHYVRETYLAKHNPTQFVDVDDKYLAGLPAGDTRGPEPSKFEPWVAMDYGPNLTASYEIGSNASNFAYKGIAVRLDAGPGGVTRGRYWMIYDEDTLRVAGAWSGQDFIDYRAIMLNGQHNSHPRIVGQLHYENKTGPGWGQPNTGDFEDPRFRGRDDRPYGPLPRDWAHYKGLYHYGNRVIVSYTVGDTQVLEMPAIDVSSHVVAGLPTEPPARPQVSKSGEDLRSAISTGSGDPRRAGSAPLVFQRVLDIGPRRTDMILQVAQEAGSSAGLHALDDDKLSGRIAVFGEGGLLQTNEPAAGDGSGSGPLAFDGTTSVQVAPADAFDMTHKDFSVHARIKTRADGSIFCKTAPVNQWVRDGKTLFISGGKLTYDIGWVGAVGGGRKVNDGRWHDVVMTWKHGDGTVQFFVDGEPDRTGQLKPKADVPNHVVRIGYTASEFPRPKTFFNGEISDVRFFQRALSEDEIGSLSAKEGTTNGLVAHWQTAKATDGTLADATGHEHDGKIVRGTPQETTAELEGGVILAGISQEIPGARWLATSDGSLRLKIPAGKTPLRFTLSVARAQTVDQVAPLVERLASDESATELKAFTKGGPARWPGTIPTQPVLGNDDDPFAVDVFTHPTDNPWFCRVRLTGFDFMPDRKRAAVSSWDGSVWMVSGIDKPEEGLTWQRIASGMFQPLGLKVVDGKIYVTCRDQLAILHDLNGDGETDYYENFNNDHQVTEHFHEFAMGLQRDDEGNFYYAKSARHAKTALVEHHGTLLRVSQDGLRTDILAKGFRAANGVCLNPDGTFFVTDQEGHWMPKNRVNWVPGNGGFYGNMFGYHDVTDSSDDAMLPPLCWITNSYDRSPAELLWVTSDQWGVPKGTLLNTSYGYGMVYVVPHEKVAGQLQGGVSRFPIKPFPTGVMRGRFHPDDGQLYLAGMFSWAGSATQPGGFYRLRYTGRPVYLPIGLQAKRSGLTITFPDTLDRESAETAANYSVKVWEIKRAARYGSKHHNERQLEITAATLAQDGKTVTLDVPDIQPTWCMEIRYRIRGDDGRKIDSMIHNTIHNLGD